ncbi:MAG: TetR/AcrR family transcriptional regulator [Gammaproteobacteria bacterium]|nr:TetR/AcrR family transcriptional regulator [Gammaproteobacteria bacterium]
MLDAAQQILTKEGFAALSTRRVALEAGVPLSQIHYHFGSKHGLVLTLLDHLDRATLERQERMYDSTAPLSARWAQACDFLEEDIATGYVRLLQECTALGWSNPDFANKVAALLDRWSALLTAVAEEAETRLGPFGPFTPAEVAELVGKAFLGAESALLLGINEDRQPIRSALRKVGRLIELLETMEEAKP